MESQLNENHISKRTSRFQKDQILREHIENHVPISQLARKYGISAVTIYLWKRAMNQNDDSITPEKIRELLSEIATLKTENKQLKYKVADLSVSNDILTDAIAIAKKREFLKQVQLLEKSKQKKSSK